MTFESVVLGVLWYLGLLTVLAAILFLLRLIGRNKTASEVFMEVLRSLL
jgi:hypothetical protein